MTPTGSPVPAPLATFEDVPWAPTPNTLHVLPGDHTGAGPSSSAMVLVRDSAGQVLLTHVDSRGWDLPGGHLDPGERAVDGARRELAEETGLALPDTADLHVVATQVLTVHAPAPPGYTYPYPVSTQPVFAATLTVPGPAPTPDPAFECSTAAWAAPSQVAALVGDRTWVAALEVPTTG